ncbi:hypothetical protein J7643_16865 [bacterium]|nr:hypothetical protein [bacterium]
MNKPLRTLLLADDGIRDRHRADIRNLENCQLIGEVHEGEAGIHFASLCQPDLVLVGISEDTLGTARRLQTVAPWAKVVALGTPEDEASRLALMQAGVSDFVPTEERASLIQLLERLAAPETVPEGLDDGPHPGKVIACYSPKGGAGRSTLAVNLAIALFRATGRETILVDGACFHGDLDLFLNLQPPQGIASVLAGGRLDGALCPHPTGIKLLGWTKGDREEAPEKLRNLVHLLRQRDAWVVVDSHPALRAINRVILELSDRVYVPMFLDIAHIRALQRDLAQWREDRLDTARFELVAWGEKSDVSRQEAGKILRRGIDFQLQADPVGARSAINQGVPMLQAEPRGAFARDLDRLIASFTEPQTRALVQLKAANPLEQFIAWIKKGPATGFGA